MTSTVVGKAAGNALGLQTIMFATDFTRASASAAQYASLLARRHGSTLLSVHVVRQESLPADVGPYVPNERGSFEERQMKAWAKQLEVFGVWHEELMATGDVGGNLCAIIEKRNVDLLVMGTHGRKGAAKLLLGSVAEEVARKVKCPVLVLGPEVSFRRWGRRNRDPEPIEEDETRLTRILLATNFSSGTFAVTQQTLALAEADHSEVTLLHVRPAPASEQIKNNEVQSQLDVYVNRLAKLVSPEDEVRFDLEYAVERGDAADNILSAAEQRWSDLIVMGARNAEQHPVAATHFSSVLSKVIRRASCPVLLLHP
ncbi:MAG TPA: universal stress protein [Terriglobales bacterium]|nr:universal stress protein [Terriglobales bacterium]